MPSVSKSFVFAALALWIATPASFADEPLDPIAVLEPTDVFGRFAADAELSGDLAVVGAPAESGGVGAAYVFNARTGEQLYKLNGDAERRDNGFGSSVDIDEGRIIVLAQFGVLFFGEVGVPFDPPTAAYVYDAATGEELFSLRPDDFVTFDDPNFGDAYELPLWFSADSVAIDGNRAIIGSEFALEALPDPATEEDVLSAKLTSAAYVFDLETGAQTLKFVPSGAGYPDFFGADVAIAGNFAAIASYAEQSVYVFDATTGEEFFEAPLNDVLQLGGPNTDRFNLTDEYLVTVYEGLDSLDDLASGDVKGTAVVYDVGTGDELFRIGPALAEGELFFAESVAIDDDILALTGFFGRLEDGKADLMTYVFDLNVTEQLFEIGPLTTRPVADMSNPVSVSGDLVLIGSDEVERAQVYVVPEAGPLSMLGVAAGIGALGFAIRRRAFAA